MSDLLLACGLGLWSVICWWLGHEVGLHRGHSEGYASGIEYSTERRKELAAAARRLQARREGQDKCQ